MVIGSSSVKYVFLQYEQILWKNKTGKAVLL